jgi:hypothetical protein
MRLIKLSALLLSLALAACGGSSKGSSTTQPAKPTQATDDSMCPVEVPGTSVTVEDTATGAAFVFVTTGDVGELRRRVAAMAKMHNEHHASMGALPDGSGAGGGGHDMSGHDMSGHDMSGHDMGGHDMGGHEGHDMSGHDMSGHDMGGHDMGGHDMGGHGGHGMMIMMHSKAAATDVQGGTRLELTVDPANVGKLQGEMRMHAQHMAAGTCAMPGGSTGGAMPNAPAETPADPHAGHH